MLCSGRHFCTLHVAMGDGCYVDSLINTSFSWCAVFAHLSGVFSPPYRRCKFEWLNRLWNFCLYTKNQNKMSDSDISSHREQRSINGPTSILFSVDVDMSHIYFIMQVFPWLIPPKTVHLFMKTFPDVDIAIFQIPWHYFSIFRTTQMLISEVLWWRFGHFSHNRLITIKQLQFITGKKLWIPTVSLKTYNIQPLLKKHCPGQRNW